MPIAIWFFIALMFQLYARHDCMLDPFQMLKNSIRLRGRPTTSIFATFGYLTTRWASDEKGHKKLFRPCKGVVEKIGVWNVYQLEKFLKETGVICISATASDR